MQGAFFCRLRLSALLIPFFFSSLLFLSMLFRPSVNVAALFLSTLFIFPFRVILHPYGSALARSLAYKRQEQKIKREVVCAPCFFLFSFALFAVHDSEWGRRLCGGASKLPFFGPWGRGSRETGKETEKQITPFFRRLFLVNKQTFQGRWGRGKVIFVFVVVFFNFF